MKENYMYIPCLTQSAFLKPREEGFLNKPVISFSLERTKPHIPAPQKNKTELERPPDTTKTFCSFPCHSLTVQSESEPSGVEKESSA